MWPNFWREACTQFTQTESRPEEEIKEVKMEGCQNAGSSEKQHKRQEAEIPDVTSNLQGFSSFREEKSKNDLGTYLTTLLSEDYITNVYRVEFWTQTKLGSSGYHLGRSGGTKETNHTLKCFAIMGGTTYNEQFWRKKARRLVTSGKSSALQLYWRCLLREKKGLYGK